MVDFIKTFEVKGYAKFDKYHNIMNIKDRYILYEDIDCYEFEEKIEVGTEPDLIKEVYSFVFAVTIPITTLLDDNSTRKGVYVCTSLKVKIWLKKDIEPMIIDFLPKNKSCKINSDLYQSYHEKFLELKDALMKVMIKLYGNEAENILKEKLKEKQITISN